MRVGLIEAMTITWDDNVIELIKMPLLLLDLELEQMRGSTIIKASYK